MMMTAAACNLQLISMMLPNDLYIDQVHLLGQLKKTMEYNIAIQ